MSRKKHFKYIYWIYFEDHLRENMCTNLCLINSPIKNVPLKISFLLVLSTHTHTHTVTTRRHPACPLAYHTNTSSAFRPSCPWKKGQMTSKTPCCFNTHTRAHTHFHTFTSTIRPWQKTGTRHGAATRSHVPGAECCLQPINQQGRLPGSYPPNPLQPPAKLPDLGPPLFAQPL